MSAVQNWCPGTTKDWRKGESLEMGMEDDQDYKRLADYFTLLSDACAMQAQVKECRADPAIFVTT